MQFHLNNIHKERPLNFISYLNKKYLLASKADFHVWIHQVLLISITSKDLLYCLNKGVVHWNVKEFLNIVGFLGYCCI